MPDSPIEEIKSKLDIVEVVREYVNLEKAGSNHRALCPFHFEKTPSFFVNQPRQLWRCFGGCNEGGDMFKFIMKVEGVEFGDALRILAKKANVELKKENPEVETKRKRLLDICDLSTLFFERQLHESEKGKKVKEYLKARGIEEDSVKEWRIGYSPTSKDALFKFLIGEGYKRDEIQEAGMAVGKGDHLYDRFRARAIFPIFNLSGSPVGFGGRVIFKNDKRAKYINTPATPLYDKSTILYGLNNSKTDIRRRGYAVIVEGYTDVILCHQAEYKNVVSSSGTALTSKQLDILGRYTKKMLTAFDMDEAGGSATKKGVDIALQKEFDVRVIMMPKDDDPADIVSRDSKEWENYVKEAIPVINFYFDTVLAKHDLSSHSGKIEAAKELLPEVKKVKNSMERDRFVRELSDKLAISEKDIYEEMERVRGKEEKKDSTREENPSKKEKAKKTRKEMLEDRIVAICIQKKELLSSLNEEDISQFREDIQNIIYSLQGKERKLSPAEDDLLSYLSLLPDYGEENAKELENCLKEAQKEIIKEKLKETEEKIREAEREGDEEKQEELIKKFRDYSEKLQKL